MVKLLTYSLLLLALTVACTKSTIQVDLSNHNEQRIVGEGFFTDSLQHQTFEFRLSTALGKSNIQYPSGVQLQIETPSEVISYTETKPGRFLSDEPFKGISGSNYTLKFKHNDLTYKASTQMPYRPDSIRFVHNPFDTLGFLGNNAEINLRVTSARKHYMRFKLYKAHRGWLATGDTVWQETLTPIYRVVTVEPGENQHVRVPIDGTDLFTIEPEDLVKVELFCLSEDVATYLTQLKKYMTSQLPGNQSYNPPSYYTNGAYGLGYGTCVDSSIYQY